MTDNLLNEETIDALTSFSKVSGNTGFLAGMLNAFIDNHQIGCGQLEQAREA